MAIYYNNKLQLRSWRVILRTHLLLPHRHLKEKFNKFSKINKEIILCIIVRLIIMGMAVRLLLNRKFIVISKISLLRLSLMLRKLKIYKMGIYRNIWSILLKNLGKLLLRKVNLLKMLMDRN